MISSVVKCPSNMVMVFDENGEQIPQYQGMYPDVRERLLREAPPEAVFGYWLDYETDVSTVSRRVW